MSREELVAMARREVDNLANDRIDLADGVYEIPTSLYYDPDRWQLEVDRIFKRLPLALGFSCEMREPGDYRSIEVVGVPVLMVRDLEGEVRAFVNMCSHRGAIVVDEGGGNSRGFRCPYHAWSYDLKGNLVSVFDSGNFGDIDKSCYGLTPLPVAERSGLIWVTLNPASNVEIDLFLAGYDRMLDNLGFADSHVIGRQGLAGPNWKVAYDGYRDLYHIPILHRNSFGPDSAYQPDYYAWGSHVRMVSPTRFARAADLPEEQWQTQDLTPGIWTIFPNISIAGGQGSAAYDGQGASPYMISQMFPGETPGSSFTIQNFLLPEEPDPEHEERYAATMKMYLDVVRDEDYYTGLRVQRALKTGAKAHSLFGRNEGGGQMFHRWIQALVDTDDADLNALLERGIEG